MNRVASPVGILQLASQVERNGERAHTSLMDTFTSTNEPGRELLDELQSLHHRFGYGSTEQLVIALRAARRGALIEPKPVEERKPYTRKTPRLLKQFVILSNSGKTIAEIAAALNISAKSVTDLRSEYGFSKPRMSRCRKIACAGG